MSDNVIRTVSRLRNGSLVAAVIGGAVCAGAIWARGDEFLQSYLLAYLFWWMASLGCLGVLMIYYLSGGYWGRAARPYLESGALAMPLVTLAFLPIAWWLDRIYPWASIHADARHISPQVEQLYLNPRLLVARAGAYFAVWLLLALAMCRRPTRGPRRSPAKRRLAAGGLVLLVLTCTFAAIDWGMSLDPRWYSTMYGALIAMGAALSGLALATAVAATLHARRNIDSHPLASQTMADLGTLLMAFLMLWAYFAFSQYLIIWSGNLPEENVWYIARLAGGWQWIGLAVVSLAFFLPFCLLLSRDLKHNPRWLAGVAMLVFAGQFVHLAWTILPSFRTDHFSVRLSDLAAPVAVGGLWMALFTTLIARRVPAILASAARLP